MKMIKMALCGAAATLACMSVASTASAATWAFNAGVATDYVFRGIDQTYAGSEGEAFGGIDVTGGQFYGGIWVSNTGPTDAKGFEYDIYAGWKPVVGSATFDFGAIFYGYTDDNICGCYVSSDADQVELKAAVTDAIGPGYIGAAVYWTPNYGGKFNGSNSDNAVYGELNAGYTFSNKATISGAVGIQGVDSDIYSIDSYTTWNVGVTYPITDHFSIDARYIGTDDDSFHVGTGVNTAVATLKATF